MTKRWLASALLAGSAALCSSPASGHGGQYTGPGDVVPPGGGGQGPGGPRSGPSGPGGSKPTGPVTPGGGPPGTGGDPSTPGGAPVATGAAPSVDLTSWRFWWEINKHRYLRLKWHLYEQDPVTGDDSFLGLGPKTQGQNSLAPTRAQIEGVIAPALRGALDRERDDDIVTACLIALAKLGEPLGEDGGSLLGETFRGHLSSPSVEVSETAVLALGILGHERAIPVLSSILRGDGAASQLLGRGEVPDRTRAFAAYALALIGAGCPVADTRIGIVGALRDALENDHTSTRDLGVAAVTGLGLVPKEPLGLAPAVGEPPDPIQGGKAQIAYLLALFGDREREPLVRAHAPTALARLLADLGLLAPGARAEVEAPVAEALLACVEGEAKERDEVVQSCVLALGGIGDLDLDPLDVRIRRALLGVRTEHADQQARCFALIALAQLARGAGAAPWAGLDETVPHLLHELSRGKIGVRTWAGLALGVLGHGLERDGGPPATGASVAAALRASFAQEKHPERLAALAIASGLLRDREAVGPMLVQLDRLRDDEARGYVAVGLGMIGDRRALAPLHAIVRESRFRPDLLRQTAIAAGLLGDKGVAEDLTIMLESATSLATQAAIAAALGFIGDRRTVDPLVRLLEDGSKTGLARAFAAVALGIVADKERLPWNSRIGRDLNYRAATVTLSDVRESRGVLDIQ